MPLPEFTKKLVEVKLSEYCLNRVPANVRGEVKLIFKISGIKVTLIETRPYHLDPTVWTEQPVAQFRFDNVNNKWLLYSLDHHDRWYLYDLIQPSAIFEDLLAELDRDPTGLFWG